MRNGLFNKNTSILRISKTKTALLCVIFIVLSICFLPQQDITSRTLSTAVDKEQSKANDSDEYLDCNDIAKLEIVRPLGSGHNKISYVVKLPSGELAVALRCQREGYFGSSCFGKNYMQHQASILKSMYDKNDEDQGSLRYYGECFKPIDTSDENLMEQYQNEQREDFTVGNTLVMEMGKPLIKSWNVIHPHDDKKLKCYASYFTPRDVQDLIDIVQKYSTFEPSPLLLAPIGSSSDNYFPHQYIQRLNVDGGIEGRIFHIDLDELVVCKDRYDEESLCSVEKALKVNCAVIREMTKIPDLSCTEEYFNSDVHTDDRIDSEHAIDQCKEGEGILNEKRNF